MKKFLYTSAVLLGLSGTLYTMENQENNLSREQIKTPYDREPFLNTQSVQNTTPFPHTVWHNVMEKLDTTSLVCISKISKAVNNMAKDHHLKKRYIEKIKILKELYKQLLANKIEKKYIRNAWFMVGAFTDKESTESYIRQYIKNPTQHPYFIPSYFLAKNPDKSVTEEFMTRTKNDMMLAQGRHFLETIGISPCIATDLLAHLTRLVCYSIHDDVAKKILKWIDREKNHKEIINTMLKKKGISESRHTMIQNHLDSKKNNKCIIF